MFLLHKIRLRTRPNGYQTLCHQSYTRRHAARCSRLKQHLLAAWLTPVREKTFFPTNCCFDSKFRPRQISKDNLLPPPPLPKALHGELTIARKREIFTEWEGRIPYVLIVCKLTTALLPVTEGRLGHQSTPLEIKG